MFRVIPKVQITQRKSINTSQFCYRKYLGDPVNIVRIFSQKKVDELLLIDVASAKERTTPDFLFLSDIASECEAPICFGGGISSVEAAVKIVEVGFEKVLLNTLAFQNPEATKNIIRTIGAASVVGAIDYKNTQDGPVAFSQSGRIKIGGLRAAIDHMLCIGVGEICLTCISSQGAMCGPDIKTLTPLLKTIDVPIIYSGGIGSVEHIRACKTQEEINAVAVGSFFSLLGPNLSPLPSYLSPANHWKLSGRK